MTRPRFTIVIPTRERPRTLRHTLATCLDQEFDDYEILVCDNGTTAATRQVVDDVGSPRVRYVRAPRPLAMSDNWELAVSSAEGEFVLVLGDDDGLMAHALRELDRLLTRTGAHLVRWEAALYTWPDIALPGQGNYLRLPVGSAVEVLDARATIASVIRFEIPYVRLPTLYNAAVHRSLIETLKARAGRIFANNCPDVYSGFALAHLAGSYPSTGVPMSVAGLSGGSFGVANIFHRGQSPLDRDFRALNEEARLPFHPWVPDLPIFPEVPVADSFQCAKEALFPEDSTLCLDRRQLLAHCLAAILGSEDEPHGIAAIRGTIAGEPALLAWLEATLAARAIAPRPAIRVRPAQLGFDGETLHLDTACFGVTNIMDAVALAEKILHVRHTEALDPSTAPAPLSARR